MSLRYSHTVALSCDYAHGKIHTVAELLLLSGELRPIKTETTAVIGTSLPLAKEQIISATSLISEIVSDIVKSMSEFKNLWKTTCEHFHRLADAVVVLVEVCSHVTHQILTAGKSLPEKTVLVDKYGASYAGLEIKLSCVQLKRARLDELSPTFIVDLCSNISKYISCLTDICRSAGDSSVDASTQDQFKLGIKSVTCAAGSLIACIKSFKADNSTRHHTRVVTFCEPVLAASHALVALATEEEFIGKGTQLSEEERETMRTVFGPCMNIVSGCVQLCKVTREFSYNISHTGFIHKAKSCQSSIQKSILHLKTELRKHFRIDFQNKAASPFRDDEMPEGQKEFFGFGTSPTGNGSSLAPTGNATSLTPTGSGASLTPTGNGSVNHVNEESNEGDGSSPRSSVAQSEFSFSTGSLSR